MIKKDVNNIKKQIIYRCLYTGIKETDILYKSIILEKIDSFTFSDLEQILDLFTIYSDQEIFHILIGKKKSPLKFSKLFNKLING